MLLFFTNAVFSNVTFAKQLRKWDRYYQRLPVLVARANLHDAVVFVPKSRNAPIGDYPFVPLEQADVVYFRTGPLPAWGLNTGDWRIAYEQYFVGRDAYIFDGTDLMKLDDPRPPAAPAQSPEGRPTE
jgi:hypothetical protein